MNWDVGTSLKSQKKLPITRAHLVEYAKASGDDNPIHLDESVAKAQGLPSVIVHGMISMAFLADLLSENFPTSKFHLKQFSTRFRKVTFPGDELVCEGKVQAVHPDGSLTVSVWCLNQNLERTTDGEAWVIPIASI